MELRFVSLSTRPTGSRPTAVGAFTGEPTPGCHRGPV